jgi:murein DD-endopeptidase MepM/ murein hydrolase activator NlpD
LPRLALLIAVLVLTALASGTAHAGSWQRPVDGDVLRAFAVGRDPYRPGQHRGVDLAAARGSPVRSACAGRVSFAGKVPRGGPTVSVHCGALVATYQQLGSIAVRARDSVGKGARLGTVGRSGDPREPRAHVHVGARVAATGRYLDPLTLFGAPPPGVPLLPPAPGRAPRAVPLGPAPGRPVPARPRPAKPRGAPARPLPAAPSAAPARPVPAVPRGGLARRVPAAPVGPQPALPWSVWAGLACFGFGLPLGGFVRLRRRRRTAHRIAQTV